MSGNTELRALLSRIRRRWFALVALRTVARALGAAAVPIAAALLLEFALRPEGAALMLLAGAAFTTSLAAALIVVWRMQRRPDDRHVARFVEERAAALPAVGPLDDALVTAVDVTAGPPRGDLAGFAPLLVDTAVRRLRGIAPSDVVEPRAIRTAALQAAAAAAAVAVAFAIGAPALNRAVDTARVTFFPSSIQVEVVPGDVRVPAGTALRVRAIVRGGEEVLSRFPPSLTVSAGGEERTVPMTREPDGFAFAFESVDRTFTYRVAAGAARSRDHTVTALFRPRVERMGIRYSYPSFSGLAPREEEGTGDIYAPAGTRVRVRVHTDKPVTAGALAMARAGGSTLALRAAGDRTYETELVLRTDDSYRVTLADADGLTSGGDTEYFIRVMDDRPPDVRILRPSADQSITPLEEVSIEARADDDYGISKFELVFSVGGGADRVLPFTRATGTDVQKVGFRLLAAEDLRVKPGDVIAYYARAWDVGRGKRPTLAQSDMFFLEVKPFSEEFVVAQSQAGASGAAGAQIESLIAAQKEIISATWNIERRAQGGMSAEDVKRVAAAQAELRQRAEQIAERSNRSRGIRPPFERLAPEQRTAQPQTPGGVAAAIEAMGRAAQQLDAGRTRDAIPHEMAALNGLLEAQAEVRRREVSRQANNGGSGGSNRSGQDLSALFDKELQRQQRTNYEGRNQIAQREDRKETNESAADRIRDLARRQEDLSRRERELADANMAAEERKRHLERLMREQTELREQAEELSRQMSQQGSQGRQASGEGSSGQQASGQQASGQQPGGRPQGQPREGQQSSSGGRGMQQAAEQMRNAAGDLQRDDARSAAENAGRAAEQLRRLEQQMRGTGADASQRATGELQMEAQQIAQEQRRIAAEADRLGRSGGETTGARRRLADEKDRLAGRVEELQRAARQQAQGSAPSGAAAAEAAKELDRERVAPRMRESAREMRDKGGSGAGEQQIAQALDRVVERLGGSSAEGRRLSEQLEQTGQLRDRLNRLEGQMRDAEARQAAAGRGQPGEQGRQGQQGGRGSTGAGDGGELQRLQQEYQRELQRAQQALGRLSDAEPRSGAGSSTPEGHEFSRSAPGTEQFKQDRSGWESLRKDVDSAMERFEAAVSSRLVKKLAEDRLNAGGSDRVPDSYRQRIARYYESLARVKK